MKFPEHKAGMTIEHNDHKGDYTTAEAWVQDMAERDLYDWKDEESKQRAIATDEIWTMQWYPNTPVGFNAVAAPTFEELLDYANRYDEIEEAKEKA